MINGAELDLLIDLGKLVKKYGPEAFRSLATWISSPDKTKELVSILSRAADIGNMVFAKIPSATRTSKEGKQVKKTERKDKIPTPKALKFLQMTEPEKHKILTDFHAQLLGKRVLPELKDVREFAVANGLKELKGSSRQKAINPLVNALAGLPLGRIRHAVQFEKGRRPRREDSLEDWTEAILERGRKNREKLLKMQNVR